MEEILLILKENANGFLATVDDGKPRVRPFGFILDDENKLYFCTNSMKNVYKQLLLIPFIEFSVTTKEMKTLRISGEIKFCEDIAIKDRVLNVYEPIKQGYKTADNPIFQVFYMEHGEAIISDFPGQPAIRLEF
jgi:uncharacterized pyridoxamine 5'-phosphate oxidase family protein